MRSKPTPETRDKQRSHARSAAHSKSVGRAVAKITQPVVLGVHLRTRLFRLLDKARKQPIVWLAAPAGSGKTTLIASYLQARNLPCLWYQMDASDRDPASFFYYLGLATKAAAPRHRASLPLLTPEYQGGLGVFSANFFRDVFRRIDLPSVVVLDNYQDAGDGPLHQLLVRGFEQIPLGVNVIVVSREEPPGWFARTQASGSLAVVGWEEMKLTETESRAIAQLRHGKTGIAREAQERLHRDAQGWVAGLVLLAEHRKKGATETVPTEQRTPQVLFDYFANEVFRQSEASVQAFLMKTAFLPRVSLAMAEVLAGTREAQTVLQFLCRRNLFTILHSDGRYEYHPLFRAFLVAQAHAIYGSAVVKEIRQSCARMLAQGNSIEDAIGLLLEAKDSQAALQLILVHARQLVDQGRSQTLNGWLRSLPEPVLGSEPQALYWLGVSVLAYAPVEARRYFEQAFEQFEQRDDASPLYLAWSGIVESYILEWSNLAPLLGWFNRYSTLASNRKAPTDEVLAASTFTLVSGLVHAQFDHEELTQYVAQAEQLMSLETSESQRFARAGILVGFYLWKGDIPKMKSMLEMLAPYANAPDVKPLGRIVWYLYRTILFSGTGHFEDSLHALRSGLELAESSGINALNGQFFAYGILGQVCAGNMVTAQSLLQRMSLSSGGGQIKGIFFRHYAALIWLHQGDTDRALAEVKALLPLAINTRLCIAVVSFYLFVAFASARVDVAGAMQALTEARDHSRRMRSRLFLSYCGLAEAGIHNLQGDYESCVRSLREALALAREMGNVTPAWCLREDAAHLYSVALDNDIESDYVRTVITKTRLVPPSYATENWPWPVRIYTLGSFAVLKDDAPLTFAGRTQKKPLELLRVLIALGGRNVPIDRIAKAFCPYRSRRVAKTAIDTTLYRLRKLLGEKSIVLQGGEMSLDARHCWLDTLALEQLVDSRMSASLRVQAEQLVHLYRGPFLPHEEATWAVLERERRRSQFLRGIARIGEALEAQGDATAALTLYQKGIEADPLAELLYQRLVSGYRRLDRLAEAQAVDQRWHSTRQALQMLPDKTRLTKAPRTLQ